MKRKLAVRLLWVFLACVAIEAALAPVRPPNQVLVTAP